ncbi:MAG: hypothetical protein Q4B70_18545 [Lachnospiraceae bacterium]|nr:hypothetical protein [Lachnospiraceae bacterium]
MKRRKMTRNFLMMLLVFLFGFGVKCNAATWTPAISYQAHVQDVGWQGTYKDGQIAGTTGKSKRMEALKINLKNASGSSIVKYRAHVQDIGWQSWKTSGQIAGTVGKSKQIEAIQIQLTGNESSLYNVYYRIHLSDKGWLGWAKNGAVAGSIGMAVRAEAIQIKIVKKDQAFSTNGSATLSRPTLTYKAHCQDYDWMGLGGENSIRGTVGNAKRMEALLINLKDFNGNNGILYRTHVSDIGWQGWKSSGQVAGTTGMSKAIEAIEIKLDGSLTKYFNF